MKWSQQAWQAARPTYDQIISHPFIVELMNGTLDKEKFLFYIWQDSYYLSEYGRVLASISTRLEAPIHRQAFLQFASDSIAVENALHASYLSQASDMQRPKVSPSCLLYTGYLHQVNATKSVEVALAAVLPCFWVYKVVGDFILAYQKKENNPFKAWIETYGGEEFAKAVTQAIDICDTITMDATPEKREELTEVFVTAAKMEWMFWDSAYKREEWPL